MTVSEVIFVSTSVVNVISLFILASVYKDMINVKGMLSQLHIEVATTLSKVMYLSQLMSKTVNGFSQFVESVTRGGPDIPMYRTTDGKYTGRSIDELISKIKENEEEDQYFSDDMNKLKNLFEESDNLFDEDEE